MKQTSQNRVIYCKVHVMQRFSVTLVPFLILYLLPTCIASSSVILAAASKSREIPSNGQSDRTEDITCDSENISAAYLVHLTAAKILALVMENETLPTLDDYSGLIKPANCSYENDDKCIQFISCLLGKASEVAQIITPGNPCIPIKSKMSIFLTAISATCGRSYLSSYDNHNICAKNQSLYNSAANFPKPNPVFHCNTYLTKNLQAVFLTFRMEYSEKIELSNVFSDLIPRFFVVELEMLNEQGKWTSYWTFVTSSWIFSMNAPFNHTYQIRVTAVSPNNVYPPATSSAVRIYNPAEITSETVAKPKRFRYEIHTANEFETTPVPYALLRWDTTPNENTSCDFEVSLKDQNQEYLYVTKKNKVEDGLWTKLENLTFETNYTLTISYKFGDERNFDFHKFQLSVPSYLKPQESSRIGVTSNASRVPVDVLAVAMFLLLQFA